jgi:hypothetical protein
MPEAFQPWAPADILAVFSVFSALLAAYIFLSSPHQPRRAMRYLALLTAVCVAIHTISTV